MKSWISSEQQPGQLSWDVGLGVGGGGGGGGGLRPEDSDCILGQVWGDWDQNNQTHYLCRSST